MGILAAFMLMCLFVGVRCLRVTRGADSRDVEPQQTDGLLPSGTVFAITVEPLSVVEPIRIWHPERTCKCKNVGCTL